MGKLAWGDKHKYAVELSAREMRVIGACLDCGKIIAENLPYKWSKVNKEALDKLCNEFHSYGNNHFRFGLYPDKIGRRAKRIK